jgi:hypothetical protein
VRKPELRSEQRVVSWRYYEISICGNVLRIERYLVCDCVERIYASVSEGRRKGGEKGREGGKERRKRRAERERRNIPKRNPIERSMEPDMNWLALG